MPKPPEPASSAHESRDDSPPYHDDEANGVLFHVQVLGRRAQGYISCALLALLGGVGPPGEEWVETYRRHRSVIDAAVARRAPLEDWDTVMVRRSDLPPDP